MYAFRNWSMVWVQRQLGRSALPPKWREAGPGLEARKGGKMIKLRCLTLDEAYLLNDILGVGDKTIYLEYEGKTCVLKNRRLDHIPEYFCEPEVWPL